MSSSRAVLIAVLATVLVGAGACARPGVNVAPATGASDSPSPSPSPADPMAELAAAIAKTRASTLTFTIDNGTAGLATMHGTGATDPANRRQTLTMTVTAGGKTMHEQAITIGTDVYLKMDQPIPGVSRKKWMHVNAAKVAGLSSTEIGDLNDPSGLESYAKAAATVRRTGPGQFEGTFDFTKLAPASVSESITSMFGDAMKAVPFTATVDDQGRLTSMVIKMPSMGEGVPPTTVTVHFNDFGVPLKIQAPAKSQVQEAPKSLFSPPGR
jgi:hypothetical protein